MILQWLDYKILLNESLNRINFGRGGLEGGFPFKECDRQSNCKSSFARGAVTFGPTNFRLFHFPGQALELGGPTGDLDLNRL